MNSMYFTEEDVKVGLMTQLIDYLCKYSYASGPREHCHYNDIHIRPDDCGSFVVEWEQAPWSGDCAGKFEFVGEEQVVCNEIIYPDGTSGYSPCSQEDEIEIWLEDHPGWERDKYGHWHKKDMYIPKESPNFTFHIFDSDSGEPIARDIPLSDEKANEIFENCEKIKAERSCVPFSKLREYMVDSEDEEDETDRC